MVLVIQIVLNPDIHRAPPPLSRVGTVALASTVSRWVVSPALLTCTSNTAINKDPANGVAHRDLHGFRSSPSLLPVLTCVGEHSCRSATQPGSRSAHMRNKGGRLRRRCHFNQNQHQNHYQNQYPGWSVLIRLDTTGPNNKWTNGDGRSFTLNLVIRHSRILLRLFAYPPGGFPCRHGVRNGAADVRNGAAGHIDAQPGTFWSRPLVTSGHLMLFQAATVWARRRCSCGHCLCPPTMQLRLVGHSILFGGTHYPLH